MCWNSEFNIFTLTPSALLIDSQNYSFLLQQYRVKRIFNAFPWRMAKNYKPPLTSLEHIIHNFSASSYRRAKETPMYKVINAPQNSEK